MQNTASVKISSPAVTQSTATRAGADQNSVQLPSQSKSTLLIKESLGPQTTKAKHASSDGSSMSSAERNQKIANNDVSVVEQTDDLFAMIEPYQSRKMVQKLEITKQSFQKLSSQDNLLVVPNTTKQSFRKISNETNGQSHTTRGSSRQDSSSPSGLNVDQSQSSIQLNLKKGDVNLTQKYNNQNQNSNKIPLLINTVVSSKSQQDDDQNQELVGSLAKLNLKNIKKTVSDMELSDNSGPVIFDLMKSPIKDLVQIKGSKNAEELNKYFENQDEILEEDKSQSDIESDNLLQKKLVLSKSKSAHVLPLTQAGKKFRSLNDLVFEKKVGEGAFGKVYRALHKESDTIYAVKSINVKYMQKVNRYHEIINEQKILEVLRDHPRIVHYYEVIQKQNMIYMVFDFAIGGDLQKWLKGRGKLDFKTGQFYIAQLVNIIAHMKVNNVTHRDLKPGNILLNEKFQLVLADFGTSIFNVQYSSESESSSSADLSNSVDSSSSKEGDLSNLKLNQKSKSVFDQNERSSLNGIKGDKKENKSDDEEGLVGTEDYIAPECLRTEKDTCQCDLWSLGVIIFELFTGKTPFKGANQTETFENILAGRMVQDFPEKMTEPTKDLITKLLQVDPYERLGSSLDGENSMESLKAHPFFDGINFETIDTAEPPKRSYHKIVSPIRSELLKKLPKKKPSTSQLQLFVNETEKGISPEQLKEQSGFQAHIQQMALNRSSRRSSKLNNMCFADLVGKQINESFIDNSKKSIAQRKQEAEDFSGKLRPKTGLAQQVSKTTTENLSKKNIFQSVLNPSDLDMSIANQGEEFVDLEILDTKPHKIVKRCFAKKKKLFIKAKREVLLFDDGCFGYRKIQQQDDIQPKSPLSSLKIQNQFSEKESSPKNKMSVILHPNQIRRVVSDNKQMTIFTQHKSFIFLFDTKQDALDWKFSIEQKLNRFMNTRSKSFDLNESTEAASVEQKPLQSQQQIPKPAFFRKTNNQLNRLRIFKTKSDLTAVPTMF